MRNRKTGHLLRDLLLYIGISVVIPGFVVVVALCGVREFPTRWIFLVAETALVFGYGLKPLWGHRHHRGFWLLWTALLGAHTLVAVPVLAMLNSPPLLLLSLLCPLEFLLVTLVMLRVLDKQQG